MAVEMMRWSRSEVDTPVSLWSSLPESHTQESSYLLFTTSSNGSSHLSPSIYPTWSHYSPPHYCIRTISNNSKIVDCIVCRQGITLLALGLIKGISVSIPWKRSNQVSYSYLFRIEQWRWPLDKMGLEFLTFILKMRLKHLILPPAGFIGWE